MSHQSLANQERAQAAAHALDEFAKYHDTNEYIQEESRIVLRDLLTNLMHFCDREAINFKEELSMATEHWGEERAD